MPCSPETFLSILYYTIMALEQIWEGPIGELFKEWFKKTHQLPKGPQKSALLNKK